MPKQTNKQQIAIDATGSSSKAIMNGNEEFDIEAAKARVLAREASRERNNAKAESFAVTAEKMNVFNREVRRRRNIGWCQKAWQDEVALQAAVDEYMEFTSSLNLRPYKEGLCLWLDITMDTYYAIIQSDDYRSVVLKKYQVSLGYYSAQTIASTEGNPSGDIYLDKSRLGYSDQPTEQTINLNIGTQQAISPGDLLQLAQNTPIEAEYQEVDGDTE